jgi:hypothetical protein
MATNKTLTGLNGLALSDYNLKTLLILSRCFDELDSTWGESQYEIAMSRIEYVTKEDNA